MNNTFLLQIFGIITTLGMGVLMNRKGVLAANISVSALLFVGTIVTGEYYNHLIYERKFFDWSIRLKKYFRFFNRIYIFVILCIHTLKKPFFCEIESKRQPSGSFVFSKKNLFYF